MLTPRGKKNMAGWKKKRKWNGVEAAMVLGCA
jgi:hypothetical protein